MHSESRRKFLGTCAGGLCLALAGAAAYPVVRYLAPRSGGEASGKVKFPEQELPEGMAKFFDLNGKTAVLIRKKGGALFALSAVCTHLGCVIQWQKDKEEFLCPCHAGRFSADGTVLGGPPPKPLAKLKVMVAAGIITVE